MNDRTKGIRQAEMEIGFAANTAIDLTTEPHTGTAEGESFENNHRHVALDWEGGTLWLDMSDLGDHFCIDVRQYRDGELQPIGTWAIIGGRRAVLDDSSAPDSERQTAHNFPASVMPILITEKS